MVAKKTDRWYRQTEALLYRAKGIPIKIMALEKQRERILNDIQPSIIANYTLSEGKNYNVSSPVEAAAIKRADGDPVVWLDQKIKNLVDLSEIITASVAVMLSKEEQELVERIYYKQQTWQFICAEKSI
ncbi:MAG: hypothetical protein ABFD08_15420, partial [Syntrophomonas sp.]